METEKLPLWANILLGIGQVICFLKCFFVVDVCLNLKIMGGGGGKEKIMKTTETVVKDVTEQQQQQQSP